MVDGLHPGRRRHRQDHPGVGAEPAGHLVEVGELRIVQVGPRLVVQAEQPPPGRQLAPRSTTGTDRSASRRSCRSRERTKSRRNAVSPSYQSWLPGTANSVGPLRRGDRQRRLVRPLAPVLVRLERRRRVDLVAAHHQGLRPGQPVPVHRQLRLGQQVRHRVRRVEAVAQVGHVVQPEPAVRPDLLARCRASREFCNSRLSRYAPKSIASSVRMPVLISRNGASQGTGLRGVKPSSTRIGAAWPAYGPVTGRLARVRVRRRLPSGRSPGVGGTGRRRSPGSSPPSGWWSGSRGRRDVVAVTGRRTVRAAPMSRCPGLPVGTLSVAPGVVPYTC